MKQLLFVLTLILTIGLLPGIGFAEKKSLVKPPSAHDGPYNPALRYEGSFKNELVFFRYLNDGWQRKPKLDRIRYITCSDALEQFGRGGTWIGNFKKDGSCGSKAGMYGEHPEWATGNWLNYQEQLMAPEQQTSR